MRRWVIVVLCLTIAGAAWADGVTPSKIVLRGQVTRVVAIGAETTGWALALDSEVQIGSRTLRRIEVSPVEKVAPFENRRVEARGSVAWRRGVERERYPIVEIETITALPAP